MSAFNAATRPRTETGETVTASISTACWPSSTPSSWRSTRFWNFAMPMFQTSPPRKPRDRTISIRRMKFPSDPSGRRVRSIRRLFFFSWLPSPDPSSPAVPARQRQAHQTIPRPTQGPCVSAVAFPAPAAGSGRPPRNQAPRPPPLVPRRAGKPAASPAPHPRRYTACATAALSFPAGVASPHPRKHPSCPAPYTPRPAAPRRPPLRGTRIPASAPAPPQAQTGAPSLWEAASHPHLLKRRHIVGLDHGQVHRAILAPLGQPQRLTGDAFLEQIPHRPPVAGVLRMVNLHHDLRSFTHRVHRHLAFRSNTDVLQNLHQLGRRVIGEVDLLLEARSQSGIGIDEPLHLRAVTGCDHDKPTAPVLHQLEQ